MYGLLFDAKKEQLRNKSVNLKLFQKKKFIKKQTKSRGIRGGKMDGGWGAVKGYKIPVMK